MSVDFPRLLADLRSESEHLQTVLRGLSVEQWERDTPAPGWSIRDQITHLAYFDDETVVALRHPADFRCSADVLVAGGMDFPDRIAADHRGMPGDTVLRWYSDSRQALLDALTDDEPRRRIPWYGPDMSVASAATARLMETWAHGQDVYDALGVAHPPSPGLRSIAHLGVATFAFTHTLHGREVPERPVHVALTAPEGHMWHWGPDDAPDRVTGAAEDFVLTVTQRRHWSETRLVAEGSVARGWLDIAQAFAGAPSRRTPHSDTVDGLVR